MVLSVLAPKAFKKKVGGDGAIIPKYGSTLFLELMLTDLLCSYGSSSAGWKSDASAT